MEVPHVFDSAAQVGLRRPHSALPRPLFPATAADHPAQAPAGEILALRIRVQGADHWQATDAKRLCWKLEQIAALPPDARAEWTPWSPYATNELCLIENRSPPPVSFVRAGS